MSATTNLTRATEQAIRHKREDARRTIAYWVILGYLFLVVLNVGLPVGLYLTFRPAGGFSLQDVKDLTSLITGALAGLLGILGFVVGYYFKSLEDKK